MSVNKQITADPFLSEPTYPPPEQQQQQQQLSSLSPPSTVLSDTASIPINSSSPSLCAIPQHHVKRFMSHKRRMAWSERYALRQRKNHRFNDNKNYFDASLESDLPSSDEELSVHDLLHDPNVNENELFLRLTRPSQIVPDINLGHRLDAGMTKRQRVAHVRRLKATELRVHNYDAKGLLMLISATTRQHYGLEKYSTTLIPPPRDRNLTVQRVPKKLLSRYYRGKLLVSRFTRHSSIYYHHKQRRRGSNLSTSSKMQKQSVDGCSDGSEASGGSSGDIHDYEYWCPSSVFYEEERKRIQRRQNLERENARDMATKRARDAMGVPTEKSRKRSKSYAHGTSKELANLTNDQILHQILREEPGSSDDDNDNAANKSNESDSSAELSLPNPEPVPEPELDHHLEFPNNAPGIVSPCDGNVPIDTSPMDTTPPEQSNCKMNADQDRTSKEGDDTFKALFNTLFTNPMEIINACNHPANKDTETQKVENKDDDVKPNLEDERETNKNVLDVSDDEDEDEGDDNNNNSNNRDGSDLTGYEKEQFLAESFSKSLWKRNSDEMRREKNYDGTSSLRRRRVGENSQNINRNDAEGPSRAWDMMKRMGFKGRLGLNEDGIREPIPMSQRMQNDKGGVGVGNRFVSNFPGKDCRPSEKGKSGESNENANNPTSAEEMQSRRGNVRKHSEGVGVTAINGGGGGHGNVQGHSHGLGRKRSKRSREVDLTLKSDDGYDTQEEEVNDNCRRGIIVDADLLISNASSRRSKALSLLIRDIPEIGRVDLKNSKKDLYDVELIRKIMERLGEMTDEETVMAVVECLDNSYEQVEKAVVNVRMVQMLQELSKKYGVRIGLLHRGSERRLRMEGDSIGVEEMFNNVSMIHVGMDDEWPYIKAMRLLACHVGVRLEQCVVLMGSRRNSNGKKLGVGGCIAGHILGARSVALLLDVDDGRRTASGKMKSEMFSRTMEMCGRGEMGLEELLAHGSNAVKVALDRPWSRKKRRRVLALRKDDQQFHCGVLEYNGGGEKESQGLVRFYSRGEREWVKNNVMVAIKRKDFRVLQKNSFPALMAPEDIQAFDDLF